jgi:hypothetical protein
LSCKPSTSIPVLSPTIAVITFQSHLLLTNSMKMRASVVLLGLSLSLVMTSSAPAQASPRPELLIVGTYHMANRNHDAYNVHADDALSDVRQRQITALVELLKTFRPTKIAIEADIDDGARVEREYRDYVAGKYSLSADETNQVGYRLARELGHARVYPVNAWAGNDFPLQAVSDYAKARGRDAQLQATLDKWGCRHEGAR